MTSNHVQDQYNTAFADVSAYVVVDAKGESVATVAFKHPRTSARLLCYLRVLGGPMVRGHADGGDYDRHTAAASVAASKLDTSDYFQDVRADSERHVTAIRIRNALVLDDGASWDRVLENKGFKVFQAV